MKPPRQPDDDWTVAEASLWYAEHGFPVLPVHCAANGRCSCGKSDCKHPGKHPRTRRGFKDATTDREQVAKWWRDWPDANIGIPTGPASGLMALDIDPRNGGGESWDSLMVQHGSPPSTAEQVTGGGGRHIMFRDPGVPVPAELAPGIDVKSAGGYVVVSPSIHPSGRRYSWDGTEGVLALKKVAAVPAWLLERFAERLQKKRSTPDDDGRKWQPGERNNKLTSIAGTMRRRDMSREAIELALLEENRRRCAPPLAEAEVRRIVESITSYAPHTQPMVGGTQAEQLVQLASDAHLFHTPEGDPFAQVPVGDHSEIWPIRSKGFRRWLIGQFYRAFRKPPGNQGLQDAIGVFEARAHFDSPESVLWVRIAEHDDRIYIDLGDEQRHAVEISAEGWRIISNPPVRFRRTKGMRALPLPLSGGSIGMLRTFLNLGGDSNWILGVSWLMAAYRPKGPYPILILQGEQGAAKSTTAKLLRKLTDPSVSAVRRPPRDDRDLLIAAANSRILAYDNLSGIPAWLSDALCQLATGGGFSTRELYTDADEVFFDAMRPIILNGIDHLAERADLADRALILNLPPIEENNRKDEAQLYAEFERDLPQIFGALLTAVCGTLARLPHTRLQRKPRMADFSLWATAAERPLGFPAGAFMGAYCGNREEAIQETLEGDPVGAAVLTMMEQLQEQYQAEQWEGTCKDLLQRLESVDDRAKAARSWPKSPRALSDRLRRLATFLRESGIHITFPVKGAKGRRILTIFRTVGETTATTATSASQPAQDSATQSHGDDEQGGGGVDQVADASPLHGGSPPEPPLPNPLKTDETQPEGGGGGEGGGGLSPESVFEEHAAPTPDGIDLCNRCGLVECRWEDGIGLWVCPNCGEPARNQRRRERIEL